MECVSGCAGGRDYRVRLVSGEGKGPEERKRKRKREANRECVNSGGGGLV